MAWTYVLTHPEGYNIEFQMDDSALNNTQEFNVSDIGVSAYSSYTFKLPVGIVQSIGNNKYSVYVFAKINGSNANCIRWRQVYSGSSWSNRTRWGGYYDDTIRPQYYSQINFYNVIPWFNNIAEASKYSLGQSFDNNAWIGGADVRVLYNWSSVPSISGKNGILTLSTIQSVYLNDGEPVNNAPANYIDFADDSEVAILVEQAIDDLSKVTVKYIVPAGTYEYIKLVYKVGYAPTSVTDGTAVNILQADKSVILSGIADGSTYFFKIFTDSTESEPYEFTTTRPVGEELFKIDLSTDGHDILRYDPNKIINVEYSYYGELRPWFSSTLGALTDANHPSQPTYTISNGELTTADGRQTLAWAYDVTANQRIIPANCTLWFEFDAYFLNSEGYLDWRMYDDQSNEVIYWCWDTTYNFSSGIWYNCQLKASVVNGIINRIEYYIDHTMVDAATEDIHMLCIDENNPIPLYFITFDTTKPTKLKNMQIYWE